MLVITCIIIVSHFNSNFIYSRSVTCLSINRFAIIECIYEGKVFMFYKNLIYAKYCDHNEERNFKR